MRWKAVTRFKSMKSARRLVNNCRMSAALSCAQISRFRPPSREGPPPPSAPPDPRTALRALRGVQSSWAASSALRGTADLARGLPEAS